MTISRHDDMVVAYRGAVIENTHRVHAAVTDATGNLLFAVGNPHRITLARSAAKPVQILSLLEVDGFDRYGFDEADVALMCASHSSEEAHLERARSMLDKIPAKEQVLRCGGHEALSPEVNRRWIREDFTPGAICNNCSAKHIGMYAAARVLDEDRAANYHLPTHQIQERVARTFQELSGLQPGEIQWAVDGCNLPAPALPLRDIGCLFARVADGADAVEQGATAARSRHLARIFNAMWRHPDMVGGKGRFCTALMSQFQGGLIGKLGADGCYGVAIRESDQTGRLGAQGAVGIAVKIEDGNIEILYAAVMEILQQLDIGTSEQQRSLSAFHYPARTNTAGEMTGRVTFDLKVRPESAILPN
ncbi:L-asparaginase II protein [Xylaria telfairii]|nr:L-asparaginase II protein [Xylaria telfairii]